MYFRCLMTNKVNEERVDQLVIEIVETSREFILFTKPSYRKRQPSTCKAYFRKLLPDWQKPWKR